MVSDDEVNFYLSGYDSYDQENFLNTGWLLMKHLFSKFEKKHDRKFNKPSRAPSEEIPEAGKRNKVLSISDCSTILHFLTYKCTTHTCIFLGTVFLLAFFSVELSFDYLKYLF